LIADDDDLFRASAAAVLTRAGFSVLQAVDGPDVLEWARVGWELGLRAPDVVIFDVHMPSLSGLELLAEVRCATTRSGRRPSALARRRCSRSPSRPSPS